MAEEKGTRPIPERVPDVTEVMGAFLVEEADLAVALQYRSGDRLYEIRFPLDQILRSEDWFIQIRKQAGDASRRQKGHR